MAKDDDIDVRRTAQTLQVPVDFDKFIAPIRLLACGSSGAGKSYFLQRIISNHQNLFDKPINRLYYCVPPNASFSVRQAIDNLQNAVETVICIEGLPSERDLEGITGDEHTVWIIEDMFEQVVRNKFLQQCFVHHSRHFKISLLLSTQNLTIGGKFNVAIRQQCTHFAIFQSIGNHTTLSLLGRWFSPTHPNILLHAMREITNAKVEGEERLNYIILDVSIQTFLNDSMRIYSNIFSPVRYFIVQT